MSGCRLEFVMHTGAARRVWSVRRGGEWAQWVRKAELRALEQGEGEASVSKL